MRTQEQVEQMLKTAYRTEKEQTILKKIMYSRGFVRALELVLEED